MSNHISGKFSTLRGAFLMAMENPDYLLKEDMVSIIDSANVSPFYQVIENRIKMTGRLIGHCLQNSGVSQAVFCDEICCDTTQLNKMIKSADGNHSSLPRSLPFPVMENLCNRFDLNMSLLFLGKRQKIVLPRRYEMVLEKMSEISTQKQSSLLERLLAISDEYLSETNTMTQSDIGKITNDDYRLFIGNRCRMYTDEKNMPPAYLIESGAIRRKVTNLFLPLNEEKPVFLGRISVLLATCYCANLPLEFFLIRDLSQPRLINDIAYFELKKPSMQQLEVLRLLCSTELNPELQAEIICEIMAS